MRYLPLYVDDCQVQVETGAPEQFCVAIEGPKGSPLSVAAYPVAWRIEVVDDHKRRGFGYVRSGLDITQCDGTVH